MAKANATIYPAVTAAIVLGGILGVLLGAALGMYLMADADPRQYPCPPGLIWGANGAVLGGPAGLVAGWLLGRVVSRRDRQHPPTVAGLETEQGAAVGRGRKAGPGR